MGFLNIPKVHNPFLRMLTSKLPQRLSFGPRNLMYSEVSVDIPAPRCPRLLCPASFKTALLTWRVLVQPVDMDFGDSKKLVFQLVLKV